ncbi:MAG: DUF2147 domain-containing protein [Cyclobacteriaceae bacterium]
MKIIELMKFISLFMFCISPFFSVAQEADDIVGIWMTEEKDAKIKIYEKNDKYFGRLIWAETMYMENGKSKLDTNNQVEKLQDRPIENLLLLFDFEFAGDEWENGKIYDPKSGKTYNCFIKLNGNQVEVTGYVGVKWMSRTVTWTRVTE